VKTVGEIERLNPYIYNVEVPGSAADVSKDENVQVVSKDFHKEGYLFMKS